MTWALRGSQSVGGLGAESGKSGLWEGSVTGNGSAGHHYGVGATKLHRLGSGGHALTVTSIGGLTITRDGQVMKMLEAVCTVAECPNSHKNVGLSIHWASRAPEGPQPVCMTCARQLELCPEALVKQGPWACKKGCQKVCCAGGCRESLKTSRVRNIALVDLTARFCFLTEGQRTWRFTELYGGY